MAKINVIYNPFDRTPQQFEYTGRLIDWMQRDFANGFGAPITIWVSGKEIEVINADIELTDDDFVIIEVRPLGVAVGSYFLQIIVSAVISYAVGRIFGPDKPKQPAYAESPEANEVYSLRDQQNPLPGFGEVIPVVYGDVLTTPPYASHPYYTYTNIEAVTDDPIVEITAFAVGETSQYFKKADADYYAWGLIPFGFGTTWVLCKTNSTTPGLIEPDGFEQFYYAPDPPPPGSLFQAWDGSRIIISLSNTRGTNGLPDPTDGFDTLTFGPNPSGVVTVNRMNDNWTEVARDDDDGDQYLNMLFVLGQGEHEPVTADDVKVGNTTLSTFEAEYYTLLDAPPNVHLGALGNIANVFNGIAAPEPPPFHENVYTSIDVGSQELTELDEETLFFPVTLDIEVTRVEVDISFSRGLYSIDSSTGDFRDIHVDLELYLEAWDITAGDWDTASLIKRIFRFRNNQNANVSPLRRTMGFNVPPGRYRAKLIRRTAKATGDGSIMDAVQWLGMRGYADILQDDGNGNVIQQPAYGDTHLVALRLKANDIISNQSANRIQVRAKRKLPIPTGLDPLAGTALTSNPAAHVYDVLTNTLYGARRPVAEYDFDIFSELYTRWASANGFNAVFNSKSTVFEAFEAILQPVIAQPLALGSLISARYEAEKDYYRQLFTESNIIKDTLSISYEFDKVGANDGFEVFYVDYSTWQQKSVIHPDNALDPEAVTLFGCSDPGAALDMAKYLYNRKRYARKQMKFDVELEGNIPIPGDKIGVQHSLVDYSEGGLILAYDAGTRIMTLDRDTGPLGATIHHIMLRTDNGEPMTNPPDVGPMTIQVTRTAPNKLLLQDDPTITIRTALENNPTHWALGEVSKVVTELIVDSVTVGTDQFTIEGTVYDARVYGGAQTFLITP